MIYTIKKHAMTLAALTIAIGTVTLMSMGLGKEVKVEMVNDDPVDWVFTGTDPLNPEHYSLSTGASSCDNTPEEICTIKAPAKDGSPDFEATLPNPENHTVYEQIQDAMESLSNPSKTPTLNETVQAFRSN